MKHFGQSKPFQVFSEITVCDAILTTLITVFANVRDYFLCIFAGPRANSCFSEGYRE